MTSSTALRRAGHQRPRPNQPISARNQVTTVKNFDSMTARLGSQNATMNGQSLGNMLNHSYTFDALGNLTTRADDTLLVGTQENYNYDSLNRLTTATIRLGGRCGDIDASKRRSCSRRKRKPCALNQFAGSSLSAGSVSISAIGPQIWRRQ